MLLITLLLFYFSLLTNIDYEQSSTISLTAKMNQILKHRPIWWCFRRQNEQWIGLDWVSNLVDWVGLDFEKWTHGHLCYRPTSIISCLEHAAHFAHCNRDVTVPLSVCLSVCHFGALCSNGRRYRHDFFCVRQPHVSPRLW